MPLFLNLLILLIVKTSAAVEGARILGIFPIGSKSHHSINQPILKGLAERGHSVTLISQFESKSKLQNYTEIKLDIGLSLVDSVTIEGISNILGISNTLLISDRFHNETCLKVLRSPYIRELINSNEKKVDLIFTELYESQCFTLLAHKLDVPVISVQPLVCNIGIDYMLGNPRNPSYVPVKFSRYATKMNFLQRLINTAQYVVFYSYQYFIQNRNMKRIASDILDMDYPAEEELNKRVALAFYNNHFSFMNRPNSPNAIDIAGIHINVADELPDTLQNYIEESAYGVIFFSFGTTIKASSMDSKIISSMMEVFSTLHQKILWRVDRINITNDIPANVKLSTWFPQRDILDHRNVVAFISHCGLLGTLEAIYTETPIIGIPFLYDQFQIAEILTEHGVGIHFDYYAFNKDAFRDAINEVINNTKYRDNMSKLSSIFKDRPMSPKDTAIFWSEYVIKNNGAPHLRTHGTDMWWLSYLLLDVILFTVVVLLFVLYSCKLVVKFTVSFICHKISCCEKVKLY